MVVAIFCSHQLPPIILYKSMCSFRYLVLNWQILSDDLEYIWNTIFNVWHGIFEWFPDHNRFFKFCQSLNTACLILTEALLKIFSFVLVFKFKYIFTHTFYHPPVQYIKEHHQREQHYMINTERTQHLGRFVSHHYTTCKERHYLWKLKTKQNALWKQKNTFII